MIQSKNYKLAVIWRAVDDLIEHKFDDGVRCFFLPRLKLERWVEDDVDKYQMYNTTSDIYSITEDELVDYAYDYGLKTLSNCLVLTYIENKLARHEEGKSELSNKQLNRFLEDHIILSKKENVINLSLILTNTK